MRFPTWELLPAKDLRLILSRFYDVRRNKFLFWSILFGFVSLVPTLYIPVINRVVFKHEAITWEWAIVVIATLLFFLGVEAWKFGKRIFFRHYVAKGRGQTSLIDWEKDSSSEAEKGEIKSEEMQSEKAKSTEAQ